MIILSSGESMTPEEIMEAALLLAAHTASFPLLSERDKQIAVLMFAQALLEHNEAEEVI